MLKATLVAGLGCMLTVEAVAQDTGGAIEEIIVQARKRSESIQEVPVAVSAVAGDQIEQLDIQSAIGLSARVPNFQAPRNTVSFGAPQFYMRGAGRANNNWNAENAVAVFVDDVYMQSTAGAFIDMIDFESVEVLRGPQGTLYGRNATTGALKFNPRRPDLAKSRIKADVTTGSNGRLDTRLSVGAPLRVDELAVKLDLYRTENDGYLTLVDAANNALDDEFGYMEHYGGRASLLWKPQDALELELNLDLAKQDDGTNLSTPIAPANPADFTQLLSKRGTVNYEPVYGPSRAAGEPLLGDGGSEFDGWGAVFKLNWQTDFGTFRSITGWREYEDTFLSQLSGLSTPSTVFGVTLWSLVDSYNEFEQLTQEFQFSGELGERLDYVLGLYYFQNDWSQLQYGATIGLPANFSPVTLPGQTTPYGGTWNDTFQDSESKAVYFDASWRLTDALSLFFGGRQTWDDKQVDYTSRLEDNVTLYPGFPVSSDESWSKFTPRAGVNWQIDERAMVYLSYAEGFKAGNLEGDRASAPEPATTWLDPEVVETWELGLKADWFDGRLRTNLAVFTSDYTDKADLISPQTAATADVGIDGVEVELTWQPLDDLRLWVNAGFLDAEYTGAESDHPIFNPDATGFVLGLDAEPVVTPEYSYSAGGNYTWQLGGLGSLELAANLVAVDDHYNGLGVQNWDSEIVEAYEVLGAAATFRSADESWSLAIGADNLTDEEYWTTGFFGSVPEYAGRYYADGRTWYARLTYLRF